MRRSPLDGEVLPPEDLGTDSEAREETVRNRFWPTLKRAMAQIPFTHDLVSAYYCAMDPDTPFRVRATLLAALAYFVAPVDAVPDFLVGFGFGDDATILVGAITMVAAHITDRHRERAREALKG